MIKSLCIHLLFLSLLISGCAKDSRIYSWGNYEDNIYKSYITPDKMPPERQIEILEADYQYARSVNKQMPPGWHAHLGYLYYQIGKNDQAVQEFQTEKNIFPESAVFMDRMLNGLKKK